MPSPPPLPRTTQQGLLNNAIGFHEGALRCEASVPGNVPGKSISPMGPAIVCFAFAAELYLKSLSVVDTGTALRGHALYAELYSKLSGGVRAAVAQHYATETGRTAASLDADCTAFEKAFIHWRYEHEHTQLSIDVQLLSAFARALLKAVLEADPALIVDGELKERALTAPVRTGLQVKVPPGTTHITFRAQIGPKATRPSGPKDDGAR